MPTQTIDWVDGSVRLIDQTLLPNELKQIYCDNAACVWGGDQVAQSSRCSRHRNCGSAWYCSRHMELNNKNIR